MSTNALIYAALAGILTVLFAGEFHLLTITNVLLGLIAGKLIDKK